MPIHIMLFLTYSYSRWIRTPMTTITITPTIPSRRPISHTAAFSSSSSSSSFVPPDPPTFHGTPVFPDIPLLPPSQETNQEALFRNKDPQAVFVVTGAHRGIGKGIVQHLLQHTQGTVIACHRRSSSSTWESRIQDPPDEPPRCIWYSDLDLEYDDSIQTFRQCMQHHYPRVNVLYNVAGISGDNTLQAPGPERSIQQWNRDWALKSMQVNCFGPLSLSQALIPMMSSSTSGSTSSSSISTTTHASTTTPSSRTTTRPPSIIANISARVGSISDNRLGGWISYRTSKAALNQAT